MPLRSHQVAQPQRQRQPLCALRQAPVAHVAVSEQPDLPAQPVAGRDQTRMVTLLFRQTNIRKNTVPHTAILIFLYCKTRQTSSQ